MVIVTKTGVAAPLVVFIDTACVVPSAVWFGLELVD